MRSLSALARREAAIAVFLATVTAAFTVVGLVRGETYLSIYLPALAASVAIVVWVDRRWGPIPSAVLWMLSVWAALHLAGGLLPEPTGRGTSEILYGMWLIDGVLRWDQLVHGFGIAAATLTFVAAARDSARPLVWGFALGQLVGAVNEIFENGFALFVDNSNVGDAVNTAWDLAWHLIGGLAAITWIVLRGVPGLARYRRPA